MNNKNTEKKDLPVFPNILPSSIVKSKFRIFEVGDFETKKDVDELVTLLFEEPECSFYYFSEKGKSNIDSPLLEAKKKGDILMNEVEFFYYRHPKFERDFVKIEVRDGNFQWDWQKNVVEKGPMFVRTTLKLSQRKRTEIETLQKIIMEENFRKQKSATNGLKSKINDSDYLPQNLWQAFLHLICPLRSPWRKVFLIFCILLIAFFAVWTTLPEKNKEEILNYSWHYGFDRIYPRVN